MSTAHIQIRRQRLGEQTASAGDKSCRSSSIQPGSEAVSVQAAAEQSAHAEEALETHLSKLSDIGLAVLLSFYLTVFLSSIMLI